MRFQTPLSSTQRGVTCLVTPSSLLLKGRGGSLGRARGGRPGRRFAMSALRCVPPSAPGSRPQPILAPAAALCTQSHLGRSRPVGIGSEPWGTRERRPQRHGPLHSPVTAPGAEGGPPAAAGTLECERGTNASFRVGHSASGSQRRHVVGTSGAKRPHGNTDEYRPAAAWQGREGQGTLWLFAGPRPTAGKCANSEPHRAEKTTQHLGTCGPWSQPSAAVHLGQINEILTQMNEFD